MEERQNTNSSLWPSSPRLKDARSVSCLNTTNSGCISLRIVHCYADHTVVMHLIVILSLTTVVLVTA